MILEDHLKSSSNVFRPTAGKSPPKRNRKSIALALALAFLCVCGTELAFCSYFAPALFQKVTDPVVQPVVEAVQAVKSQMDLWRFRRRRDFAVIAIVGAAGEYFTPRPVPFPDPPQVTPLPVIPEVPPKAPAITEFLEKDDGTFLTGGKIPCVYYNQTDEAWRDKPYGYDTIGPYGCGPTAMSIVISSMTSQKMDPAQMAQWAYEHGYWCSGSGSYLTIVEETCKAFSLDCILDKQCTAAALREHLNGGGFAIALMGPGHFASNGHFIVLHGSAPSGEVLIADSNSRENSLALWDPQFILDEAAASNGDGVRIWLISSPES